MFRVERSADGEDWTTLMASPSRIGIDDLHGPPGPHSINHTGGGDMFAGAPSPGNKTVLAGGPGWQARVRYEDTVIERYVWDRIPINELDPESDTIWGWKLIAQARHAIPAEKLYPLSFPG